jgi:hypothetical protein
VKIVATSSPSRREPKFICFGGHDTRRNLPAVSSAKRGEANFLGKFERAYFSGLKSNSSNAFARGREFTMNGYGRADVIWVAWRGKEDGDDFSAVALQRRVQLTAIEAKLKDWRKGLIQASRYRHFSNRAILVLPPASAITALAFLDTFRLLGVGLWEFDPQSEKITKHSTPRMARPLSARAHTQAIEMIEHRLKLR